MTDNPASSPYFPPVDLLLVYGEPEFAAEWPDYLALGFTETHIPELIRMALDPALNWADSESLEVYAPIHAWRTLGQLRAQAAIEPLLALFHMFEEDQGSDWVLDELPQVYAMIGAAAIPALSAYLLHESHGDFPRENAARSLRLIAERHADFRADCIAPIAAALEKFETNTSVLNSLLIATLTDLKAEETLPLMERVFASENVELFGFDDWDDVQVEFGLKEADPNKQRNIPDQFAEIAALLDRLANAPPGFEDTFDDSAMSLPPTYKKANAKDKAKRKQAAKSRKINRKKRK